MTLTEIFIIYSDDDEVQRLAHKHREYASYSVGWLKQLKSWANEESRQMGFLIPQCMIDDANADDWEVVTKTQNLQDVVQLIDHSEIEQSEDFDIFVLCDDIFKLLKYLFCLAYKMFIKLIA